MESYTAFGISPSGMYICLQYIVYEHVCILYVSILTNPSFNIHNNKGLMEGGEGIIGLPDDGTVQKYTLGNNPRVECLSFLFFLK